MAGEAKPDASRKLAAMANQIAAFFRPYPAEAGAAGVREHVEAFWTPAMRRDLAARVARDPAELDPLVIAAFRGTPAAESPAHRETAGPTEAGQIGASDAG